MKVRELILELQRLVTEHPEVAGVEVMEKDAWVEDGPNGQRADDVLVGETLERVVLHDPNGEGFTHVTIEPE